AKKPAESERASPKSAQEVREDRKPHTSSHELGKLQQSSVSHPEDQPMNRKATALDVAKLAGVSRSAVSLVLNGRGDGNVALESQRRIREAASALSYSPNAIALSLRNQRTRVIGIVSDHVVVSAFDGNIIGGADDVARSCGFVT